MDFGFVFSKKKNSRKHNGKIDEKEKLKSEIYGK